MSNTRPWGLGPVVSPWDQVTSHCFQKNSGVVRNGLVSWEILTNVFDIESLCDFGPVTQKEFTGVSFFFFFFALTKLCSFSSDYLREHSFLVLKKKRIKNCQSKGFGIVTAVSGFDPWLGTCILWACPTTPPNALSYSSNKQNSPWLHELIGKKGASVPLR